MKLEDLNDLTPMFLSSCVMIHIDEQIWTWKDLILSSFSYENSNYELNTKLEDILINSIKKLESYDIKYKSAINISFLSKISMTITLLKTYLKNDKCSLKDLPSLIEFTLLWSFITHIHLDSRKQFENWWRQTFNNIPKEKSVRYFFFKFYLNRNKQTCCIFFKKDN